MNPNDFETAHVHSVYDTIYKRFDETRYSAWKAVDDFISQIKPYSMVLDVGCGNGKYCGLLKHTHYMGVDMSPKLAQLTKARGVDVMLGNCLRLPFKSSSIDYVLCVAMLHHLSTSERRYQCIREMLRVLKNDGQCIITVWAQESKDGRKGNWTKLNDDGDYFVPWKHSQVLQRYYHFFTETEIKEMIDAFKDVADGNYFYDRDNWNVIMKKIEK